MPGKVFILSIIFKMDFNIKVEHDNRVYHYITHYNLIGKAKETFELKARNRTLLIEIGHYSEIKC